MTTEELCAELACPPETPAGGLLAAWERRRAELDAALVDGTRPRPVKLRLREERRRLDEAESLAASLKLAAEAEGLLTEFRREAAKPQPSPAVLRLCLEKTKPLTAQIADAALAFACERQLAECEDALKAVANAGAVAGGADPGTGDIKSGKARGDHALHLGKAPGYSASGTVLELAPVITGETLHHPSPRYRIIAKDTIRLGRQSTADCPARYALDTEENRHRLSTISRIQTTLFARGGRILVQDGGEEGKPSRNGTIIDEQRIEGPIALNFAKERRFVLGQFGYEIRVQYFSEGFVRFTLPATADRGILPLWLLTAVTVGSSPTAGLRLDATYPPLVARILCRNNTRGLSFTLEVQKNPVSHVALDGAPCAPGATIALQNAQLLQLGNVTFAVGIA